MSMVRGNSNSLFWDFWCGLGFLWYNAPPAAVFMGDTGSLALGALSVQLPLLRNMK